MKIENPKTTSEAANNYGECMKDAIHSVSAAIYWLEKVMTEDTPDTLSGPKGDRVWASEHVDKIREIHTALNEVLLGKGAKLY